MEYAHTLTAQALTDLPTLAALAEKQSLPLRRTDWTNDEARIETRLEELGLRRLPPPAGPAPTPTPTPTPTPGPGIEPQGGTDRDRWLIGFLLLIMMVGGVVLQPPPNSMVLPPGPSTPAIPTSAQAPTSQPAQAPTLPRPDNPSTEPAPPTSYVTVHSRVTWGNWKDATTAYQAHHSRFLIEATSDTERSEAQLDVNGQFSIRLRVPDSGGIRLIWKSTSLGRYVLWPVTHPTVDLQPRTAARTDLFRFNRLDDIYGRERRAALGEVKDGNFKAAHARFGRLDQLLNSYSLPEDQEQFDIQGERQSIASLRFSLLQQLCREAADYRDRTDRENLRPEMVGIEREWRKLQLVAARSTPLAVRHIPRALNAWAAFSVQVYSHERRQWLDRTDASPTEPLSDNMPRAKSWSGCATTRRAIPSTSCWPTPDYEQCSTALPAETSTRSR